MRMDGVLQIVFGEIKQELLDGRSLVAGANMLLTSTFIFCICPYIPYGPLDICFLFR